MPRRRTTRPTQKLPDRPPRYSSNIITNTFDIQATEETFDQMYEEALSDAFASRLNEVFDGSFDKAFEDHFNGVYNIIIRNKFDSIFDKINDKKARMRGGDQGCSSTTGGTGEGESTGTCTTPLQPLKKDYQPHDIIRRKIRHGISLDIRKEILFRVREVVKKDLEPEVRKSITREAFWDVLQESKSKNNRENQMARTKLPAPKVPPKVPQSNSTDNENLIPGTTKLSAAKGKQSKSRGDQTVMAHTRPSGKGQPKVKDDQNFPSRKPNLPAKRQHSKFSEDLD